MYKPKQEIKDSIRRLVLEAELLQDMKVRKGMYEQTRKARVGKDLKALYEENSKLRKRIEYLETKVNIETGRATVDNNSKCAECKKII